ncbi:TPA: nicotinamide riboside transporter PnuC [Escherichia coli]|nr:nicotinamide riboside transporter PnuC [Escherichia coli]
MDFFSVQNILVHIPIGAGGYDLSWIEAVGTIAGLLCIGLASLEKISNYFFGLINVTLFGIIFFQIQLYASLLLQVFFFAANIYGWYAWSRQTSQNEAELKIRWLPLPKALSWLPLPKALSWLAVCVVSIGLMTVFINPVFAFLTRVAVMIMQALGLQVAMPELQPDAFPFWDSCMMVLSIVAMILMTRKYVENWLLWVIINVISVVIFALQGVYAMSLEYIILTFIALNGSRMWINSARERGSRALSH